jgi:hypothetical protein
MKLGTGRQTKQINSSCGNVLPHLARRDSKPACMQFVVQFRVNQMHLPQVGLIRILCHSGTMLNFLSPMRISFYAQTSD